MMLELLVVGIWACLAAYCAWFFLSAKERERMYKRLEDLIEKKTRELRKSEERFRGIYDCSKDAIGYATLDGALLDVNDSFCKLTGYSREELLARKYQDITPKEYDEAEAKIVEGILRTGKPAEYEKEYIRKDGSLVPVLLTVFVVKGADGKPTGLAAITKDVTERKRMEEDRDRLFKAIEIAKEAISIASSDAVIIYTNDAMDELFGYKKGELIGKHTSILYAGPKPNATTRRIPDSVCTRAKDGHWEGEIHNRRKDCTEFLSYAIVSAVKDKDGKISYFISTQHDITERKRLQEKLLRSEKLAAIGQLASAVGHEIRNPLGVIKNSSYFLSMKLRDIADEKVMKHLKILQREVDSANLIVSDLLDFARKKPPTLKQTSLNDVVADALSHVSIPENIKATTKLVEIPPMLLDREQIRRVFQNLILNAVQAMPEGGKLTIKTVKHEDSVKITLKDTGVGITEENLPKLFTPLFSTKARGIGLGLTICKQIVEDHGGNITVESKASKGSTFTIGLPIRVEEEVDERPTITVGLPAEMGVKK